MGTDVSSRPIFLSKKRRIGSGCYLRANQKEKKKIEIAIELRILLWQIEFWGQVIYPSLCPCLHHVTLQFLLRREIYFPTHWDTA